MIELTCCNVWRIIAICLAILCLLLLFPIKKKGAEDD